MATALNSKGKANALARIKAGDLNTSSTWSFSAADGDAMLGPKGDDWAAYALWHMGVDSAEPEQSKAHYKYPFGKGGKVYASAMRAVKSRAAAQGDSAVESAATDCMDAMPEMMKNAAPRSLDRSLTLRHKPVVRLDITDEAKREITLVASDESTDRYGDIIRADGWDLSNYKQNPVLLFAHDAKSPPIGTSAIKKAGKQLIAVAQFLPEGVYDFADTLWRIVKAGALRACSVGFMPTVEPNFIRDAKNDYITGLEYIGQELVELSIVPIPANPSALSLGKSLSLNPDYLQQVFVAESASAQLSRVKAEVDALRLRVRS